VWAPPSTAPPPYCVQAANNGIRLILALGNFWQHYKSPEEFLLSTGQPPAPGTLCAVPVASPAA